MPLPKIIKDRVDLEVSPQLCVSLFPEDMISIPRHTLEGRK